MAKVIAVYDGHTRKRLAYLQNAYNISYTKNTASLWTGAFSLPYTDPKTKYCKSFNLIELWDEDAGGEGPVCRVVPYHAPNRGNPWH